MCQVEFVTSLSATEGIAASEAVVLRIAELVLGPEEAEAWTATGVETAATGTFLSKPCWLPVLDTDDYKKGHQAVMGTILEYKIASTLFTPRDN